MRRRATHSAEVFWGEEAHQCTKTWGKKKCQNEQADCWVLLCRDNGAGSGKSGRTGSGFWPMFRLPTCDVKWNDFQCMSRGERGGNGVGAGGNSDNTSRNALTRQGCQWLNQWLEMRKCLVLEIKPHTEMVCSVGDSITKQSYITKQCKL